MTEIDTAAVRALCANASPAPWALESAGIMDAYRSRIIVIPPSSPDAQDDADLKLIVNAPTLLLALCDEIDRERDEACRRELAANEHVEAVCEALRDRELDVLAAEADRDRLRAALEALRSLMAAPTHASRDALDQWTTVIDAALVPSPEPYDTSPDDPSAYTEEVDPSSLTRTVRNAGPVRYAQDERADQTNPVHENPPERP